MHRPCFRPLTLSLLPCVGAAAVCPPVLLFLGLLVLSGGGGGAAAQSLKCDQCQAILKDVTAAELHAHKVSHDEGQGALSHELACLCCRRVVLMNGLLCTMLYGYLCLPPCVALSWCVVRRACCESCCS